MELFRAINGTLSASLNSVCGNKILTRVYTLVANIIGVLFESFPNSFLKSLINGQ